MRKNAVSGKNHEHLYEDDNGDLIIKPPKRDSSVLSDGKSSFEPDEDSDSNADIPDETQLDLTHDSHDDDDDSDSIHRPSKRLKRLIESKELASLTLAGDKVATSTSVARAKEVILNDSIDILKESATIDKVIVSSRSTSLAEIIDAITDAYKVMKELAATMEKTVAGNNSEVADLVDLRASLHKIMIDSLDEIQRHHNIVYTSYLDLRRLVDSLAYWSVQSSIDSNDHSNLVRAMIENTHPDLTFSMPRSGNGQLKIFTEDMSEIAARLSFFTESEAKDRYTSLTLPHTIGKTFPHIFL